MSALAGKRIVNTRAVHQAGELDELLRAHGAVPLAYPCIAIEPVTESAEFDVTLADLFAGRFDWLALTSANTVHALAKRAGTPQSALTPAWVRVAVVGPGTAEAAWRELGLRAEVMPASYRAIELAAAMPVLPGERVLLPQSEIASPALANALRAKGALVTEVTAYRTVTGTGGVELPALLTRNEVDAIVFASSSAVDGLFARFSVFGSQFSQDGTGLPRSSPIDLLTSHDSRLTTVCIGPNTARTARSYGLSPIVPAEGTRAGIIHALESEFMALSGGLAS